MEFGPIRKGTLASGRSRFWFMLGSFWLAV